MGKELEFIEELKALARELKQQGFSNEEIQARLDAKKKEFKSVKKSTTPKSPGVDTENFSGSELDDFFSDSVTEENASAPWEKKAYESEFVGPKIPEKGLPEFQYLSDPKIKNSKKILKVEIPTWRPDITQDIDLIEELIRIKGFDKIKLIEPEKKRNTDTLNFSQKLFHLSQRALASKGYLEAITWSFTDSNIDKQFSKGENEIKIYNPISSDLNVLRRSIAEIATIAPITFSFKPEKFTFPIQSGLSSWVATSILETNIS